MSSSTSGFRSDVLTRFLWIRVLSRVRHTSEQLTAVNRTTGGRLSLPPHYRRQLLDSDSSMQVSSSLGLNGFGKAADKPSRWRSLATSISIHLAVSRMNGVCS